MQLFYGFKFSSHIQIITYATLLTLYLCDRDKDKGGGGDDMDEFEYAPFLWIKIFASNTGF